MTTYTLPTTHFCDLSSAQDLENNRERILLQTWIENIVDFECSENVRGYLAENIKKRTSVHKAIAHTLHHTPDLFSVLNGGLTIVCEKVTVVDDLTLELSNPSIINGAQTQGVIRDYLRACDDAGEEPNKAQVTIEVLVSDDPFVTTSVAISRNTQNDVKSLSISGRLGYLDELNMEMNLGIGKCIKMSESDSSSELIDTEKLLQVLAVLMPTSLSGKLNEDKVAAYTGKARVLAHFGNLYKVAVEGAESDGKANYEEQYAYMVSFAPRAWQIYQHWASHQGFLATNLRNGIARDSSGDIAAVSDGLIFPILAAISNFITKHPDGQYDLVYPVGFDDSIIISAAKYQFKDVNRSQPASMGRSKQTYHALSQITQTYFNAEARYSELRRLIRPTKSPDVIEDLVVSRKVKTTAVSQFEYNYNAQTLTVCYVGKSKEPVVTKYLDVPVEVYKKAVESPSLGKALNTEIRNKYLTA
jgi:AIPR protein/KTSC domain